MIIVDDTIPINNRNNILLPSTYKASSDSTVEIWPFLLAKALLKITAIMRCLNNDSYDEVIMHSLTGWDFLDKIHAMST